jgi:phosphoglycerate kinase
LSEKAGLPVTFVPDIVGDTAKEAINGMEDGQVILLDNVRTLDDEIKGDPAKAKIVKELAPLADVFVLDAFSVAHRAQASVVGFGGLMPCVAGRIMEMELRALAKFENPRKPVVFVLGGAKPEDSLPVMAQWLREGKLAHALTCGALGNLFLLASGRKLGAKTEAFLKEKGALELLPQAEKILGEFANKIYYPTDVAVEREGQRVEVSVRDLPVKEQIMDIGVITAKNYMVEIAKAETIMMNGPAGVYENPNFGAGTEFVLRAIEHAHGFTLLGGGHTLSALDKFSIDKRKLGYVSLAGKALIEYLSGKKLPGIVMLEKAAEAKGKK